MAKNAKTAKKPQTASTNKKASADQSKFQAILESIKKWFRELKAEIKKIQWLKGKELWKNFLVVLLVILVIGIGVWVEDALLVKIRELIFDLSTRDAEAAIIMFQTYLGAL